MRLVKSSVGVEIHTVKPMVRFRTPFVAEQAEQADHSMNGLLVKRALLSSRGGCLSTRKSAGQGVVG